MIVLFMTSISAAVTTSGWYYLTDLEVEDAPMFKSDGRKWDAIAAAADLQLILTSNLGDGTHTNFTTNVLEEAGTSGTWDIREDIVIYCSEELEGFCLLFALRDHDNRNHDEMDSIWVDAADLTTQETNEITLERGTIVRFNLTLIEAKPDGLFWD
ncbi:MAG: hypothetical protein GQ565_11200 [Candidatus Aegiribacteria sp.]|nr:hypothetical protein [Candidatus Aegiribacteria sp.]